MENQWETTIALLNGTIADPYNHLPPNWGPKCTCQKVTRAISMPATISVSLDKHCDMSSDLAYSWAVYYIDIFNKQIRAHVYMVHMYICQQ